MTQVKDDLAELLRRVEPPESYARVTLKQSEGCGCILGHIHEITIRPLPVYTPGLVDLDPELGDKIQSFYIDLAHNLRAQHVLGVLFPDEEEGMSRVEEAYGFNDRTSHQAVVTLVRDALARVSA